MQHDQKRPRIEMQRREFRLLAKELPKWGYLDILAEDRQRGDAAGKASGRSREGCVFRRKRPGFDLYVTGSADPEDHAGVGPVSVGIIYAAPAHRNFEMLLLAFDGKSHWMRDEEYCASLACAAEPQGITNAAAALHEAIERFRANGGAKDALDAREIQVMLRSAFQLVPNGNAHKAAALERLTAFLALCGEKFECELLLLRTNADLASAMDLVADKGRSE